MRLKPPPLSADQVAVIVPNWLGDSVMAMPALQAFCRLGGHERVTIVAKSRVLPLWQMHPNAGACLDLEMEQSGVWAAARQLAALRLRACYVLPNSVRSALVPMLARVPARIGQRGHRLPGMLTHIVKPALNPDRYHQSWEYMDVMGCGREAELELPRLLIPGSALGPGVAHFGLVGRHESPIVAVLPGAAFGPSKRWPAAHFAQAAQALVKQAGCRVAVLGSKAEQAICAAVATEIGPRAVNLAGGTTLAELAALLARCSVVLCNDSGGMHLAAAVGSPVVAVYGVTDPFKTGPLGAGHRLVMTADIERSRDLSRDSATAQRILAGIGPERVIAEALSLLRARELAR